MSAVETALLEKAGILVWEQASGGIQVVRPQDRIAISLKRGQLMWLMKDPRFFAGFPGLVDRGSLVRDLWESHSDGDLLELLAATSINEIGSFSIDGGEMGYADPVPFLNRDMSVRNLHINGKERIFPGDRLIITTGADEPDLDFCVFEFDCFAQVISRTRNPRFDMTHVGVVPWVLNLPETDLGTLPDSVNRAIQLSRRLPLPALKHQAIDEYERAMLVEHIEAISPKGEFWLEALRSPQRKFH